MRQQNCFQFVARLLLDTKRLLVDREPNEQLVSGNMCPSVTGHLGDKPTGRQILDDWATRFAQLGGSG